jgi:hypothetical protein
LLYPIQITFSTPYYKKELVLQHEGYLEISGTISFVFIVGFRQIVDGGELKICELKILDKYSGRLPTNK